MSICENFKYSCTNGKKLATFEYTDDSKYVGEFVCNRIEDYPGIPHGEGVLTKNNCTFTGQFENGKFKNGKIKAIENKSFVIRFPSEMEVKNGSVLLDYKVFANITSVSKILANKSTPTSEKNEEIMEDVNNGVSEENNAPVPLDIPIKHVTKETVVSDDEDEYVNELEPDDESSENLENTEEAVMKFTHGKKTLVLMSDGHKITYDAGISIYTIGQKCGFPSNPKLWDDFKSTIGSHLRGKYPKCYLHNDIDYVFTPREDTSKKRKVEDAEIHETEKPKYRRSIHLRGGIYGKPETHKTYDSIKDVAIMLGYMGKNEKSTHNSNYGKFTRKYEEHFNNPEKIPFVQEEDGKRYEFKIIK